MTNTNNVRNIQDNQDDRRIVAHNFHKVDRKENISHVLPKKHPNLL